MLSIIAVILGLGAIILVHELGHFLTARVVGIPVERFSIGFPPHFLKIKGKSTEYCLGVIPLGGYVKIQLGIDGETTPEGPWYSRMAVVFGGPFFNFLFAGIVFVLILGFIGQEHAVFSNVVGNEENALGLAKSDTILAVNTIEVIDYSGVAEEMEKNPEGVILVGTSSGRISLEYSFSSLSEIPGFEPFIVPVIGETPVGMPAYEAGLRPEDRILRAGGREVSEWNDFQFAVLQSGNDPLMIVFERAEEIDSVQVNPMRIEDRWLIGVFAKEKQTVRIRLPFDKALIFGFRAAIRGVAGFYTGIGRLFTKPAEVIQMSGGPVFVVETLGQQAGMGLVRFLETVAIISIAILGFNLLPVPMLDGGHLFFLMCEGIRGKPLSKQKIQIAHQAGLLLILALFLLLVWKDFSRIIVRN